MDVVRREFLHARQRSVLATAWISGDRYLDTPKLLKHGAHPITIGLYCVLTIGFGYMRFRRSCIRVLTSTQNESVDVGTSGKPDRQRNVDEQAVERERRTTSDLK